MCARTNRPNAINIICLNRRLQRRPLTTKSARARVRDAIKRNVFRFSFILFIIAYTIRFYCIIYNVRPLATNKDKPADFPPPRLALIYLRPFAGPSENTVSHTSLPPLPSAVPHRHRLCRCIIMFLKKSDDRVGVGGSGGGCRRISENRRNENERYRVSRI